jgi:hypothetical protein
MKYAMLLVLAALMGCSDGAPPTADDGAGTGVQLVTLKDGTRCAVAYGGSYSRPSGVDCDWSTSPRVEK